MAHIRLEVDGQVQLSRNLRVFSNRLSNMGSFYRESINIIDKRNKEVFDTEGRTVEKGNKWAKLAPSTEKARENRWGYYKKKPVGQPSALVWTGNLRDNVKKKYGNNYGKLTFKAPYAIYHHKGGGNLPKRQIIDLSKKTNTEIVKALQAKIQKDMGIFGRQV